MFLPHLSGLPYLSGVPLLHVNRPLHRTKNAYGFASRKQAEKYFARRDIFVMFWGLQFYLRTTSVLIFAAPFFRGTLILRNFLNREN